MSEPTPLQTLQEMGDHITYELQAINPPCNPVVAQYQLACIRDIVCEMYALSARLTKQLQNDAAKLTKKDDTNG